jgi:hypothetical protein
MVSSAVLFDLDKMNGTDCPSLRIPATPPCPEKAAVLADNTCHSDRLNDKGQRKLWCRALLRELAQSTAISSPCGSPSSQPVQEGEFLPILSLVQIRPALEDGPTLGARAIRSRLDPEVRVGLCLIPRRWHGVDTSIR